MGGHPGSVIDMFFLGLVQFTKKPKIFQDSPSHQILRHMHGALNIDENKN